MIKFLKLTSGDLVNVNEIKRIEKNIHFTTEQKGSKNECKAKVEIDLLTHHGLETFVRVTAAAPFTDGEKWDDKPGICEAIHERINGILDVMISVVIDKMNDDTEKIIDIYTGFLASTLEESLTEEAERG